MTNSNPNESNSDQENSEVAIPQTEVSISQAEEIPMRDFDVWVNSYQTDADDLLNGDIYIKDNFLWVLNRQVCSINTSFETLTAAIQSFCFTVQKPACRTNIYEEAFHVIW